MSNVNGDDNLSRLAGLQGGSQASPAQPTGAQPVAYPPQQAYYPPGTQYVQQQRMYAQPQNGMGVAALVLGIIGMVPFPITGFWCSLLAIIFGAIGRKRVRLGTATNKVMATWGLWLGIVGMGVQVLLAISIATGSV